MKHKYENDYTIKKWITILIVVLILVFLFFILLMGHGRLMKSESIISDNDTVTLIISFIGVLATFVVVSNFSQVANIEQKTDKKIRDMEKRLNEFEEEYLNEDDDASLPSQIRAIRDELNLIKEDGKLKSPTEIKEETENSIKEKLKSDLENNTKAAVSEVEFRSLQMLKFANAMINSKQKDLLQKLLTDITTLFKVTYIKNGHTRTNNARIQIKEGELVFISDTGKTTYTNIIKIDGVTYHPEEIDLAIIFIIEASTKMAVYDKMSSNGILEGDDQL